MTMVNANEAINRAQQFNRTCWLKDAEKRLSNRILEVAATGIRECSVAFKDLIIGAENLAEVAEMLALISESLVKAGYNHKVTPNGFLIISW